MVVLKNPFFLTCVVFFIIHQICEKILGWRFIWADNYLDTLLCMPILLGLLLIERNYFKKKIFSGQAQNNTYTFSFFEIIIITTTLSLIFEEGFPRWFPTFTKDYIDYLNYFIGGLFFYFFINPESKE